MRSVLRLGSDATLAASSSLEVNSLLPRRASDRELLDACQLPLEAVLKGHRAACVLCGGGFEPFAASAVVASAVRALTEDAPFEYIVRLRLSLVHVLSDDKLRDLLPGAADPSAPRIDVRDGPQGVRIVGAVQRIVRDADEVAQLLQAALHTSQQAAAPTATAAATATAEAAGSNNSGGGKAQAQPQAVVAQLLVDTHRRFGGSGEPTRGCVTVVDLSGWDVVEPQQQQPADGVWPHLPVWPASDVGANRALQALSSCIDALADSSRRRLAARYVAPSGPSLQIPWRASKLTRMLRDHLGAGAAPLATTSLALACSVPAGATDAPGTGALLTLAAHAAAAAAFLGARPAAASTSALAAAATAPGTNAARAAADWAWAAAQGGGASSSGRRGSASSATSLRALHEAVTAQEQLLRCLQQVAPEALQHAKAALAVGSNNPAAAAAAAAVTTAPTSPEAGGGGGGGGGGFGDAEAAASPCSGLQSSGLQSSVDGLYSGGASPGLAAPVESAWASSSSSSVAAASAASASVAAAAAVAAAGPLPQPPQPPLALLAELEEEEWEVVLQEGALLYGEQLALERECFEIAEARLSLAAELVWLRAAARAKDAAPAAAAETRAVDARLQLEAALGEVAPSRAAAEANAARVAALRAEAPLRVPSVERQQTLRLCLANHRLHLAAERQRRRAALVSGGVGGVLSRWAAHSLHESDVQQLLHLAAAVADELEGWMAAADGDAEETDAGIVPWLRPPDVLCRAGQTLAAPPPATPDRPRARPAVVSLAAMAAALEGHGGGARPMLKQALQSLQEARRQRLSLRQLHDALSGALPPKVPASNGAPALWSALPKDV